MPAKKGNKVSAKSENKAKAKIIEDKTFGLKNKNRSKAVQKYVQNVQTNVKNSGSRDARKLELEREKKKQEKEEKKAKEREMGKLYQEEKKNKPGVEESAAAAAAAERGEYLWTADDFDEVEVDDSRLEEKLEKQRDELSSRTDLTPVNEETFQAWWLAKKEKQRKERDRLQKKQIKSFKQTGRGISGRALFEHDATIFVDDQNADDAYERESSAAGDAEDGDLFDGEDLPDEDED
eukprot:TRINITY_DN6667_c3_g1_i1.p1 TRINITY_DN6667_c3_g1~~TRINITY_DN6667_c3_g1_i1.p1  ORF type:complete len:236 (+),score=82.86 TRINITY_DN6667_c3_g1_i1:134-841(+)